MGYSDLSVKSNSLFLKVEAGAPKDLRLLEETPTEILRHTINTGGAIKSFDCSGPETCAYCKEGDHEPAKQRFVTNIWDHGSKRVMLFEFGAAIAKQLKSIALALAEEDRDIMDVDLRIEATGSGLSKKYSVTPRMTAREVPAGIKLHPTKKSDLPF